MTPDLNEPAEREMGEPDGMVALAIGVCEQRWPHTMDARVWAQEFNKALASLGHATHDEGWLISWFANAVMAGFDTASMRSAQREAKLVKDAERWRYIRELFEHDVTYSGRPCFFINAKWCGEDKTPTTIEALIDAARAQEAGG